MYDFANVGVYRDKLKRYISIFVSVFRDYVSLVLIKSKNNITMSSNTAVEHDDKPPVDDIIR